MGGGGLVERLLDLVAQRRAQRRLEARLHRDVVDERRKQPAAVGVEQLRQRADFRRQPVGGAARLLEQRARLLLAGATGAGLAVRRLRQTLGLEGDLSGAFDGGDEACALRIAGGCGGKPGLLAGDRLEFARHRLEPLADLRGGARQRVAAGGDIGEPGGGGVGGLLGTGERGGRFVEPGGGVGAARRDRVALGGDGLRLGGEPCKGCGRIAVDLVFALKVVERLVEARLQLRAAFAGLRLVALKRGALHRQALQHGGAGRLVLA